MEIDFDFEPLDPISSFLTSKLAEVKKQNENISKALKHRIEIEREVRENAILNQEHGIAVDNTWKKIYNGKYVIGLELRNNTPNTIQETFATLSWTALDTLYYKFFVLDDEKFPNMVKNSICIILCFDIPNFLDSLSYNLSGCIHFTYNDRMTILPIPSLILNSEDVTNKEMIVNRSNIIEGSSLQDFLGLLFSNEKYDFVLVHLNDIGFFDETLLPIDCKLQKIDFGGNFHYYLVLNISHEIDGVVLELQNGGHKIDIRLFSPNLKTTVAMLHYLHNKLSDVVLIPKNYYQASLTKQQLRISLAELIEKQSRLVDNLDIKDLLQEEGVMENLLCRLK